MDQRTESTAELAQKLNPEQRATLSLVENLSQIEQQLATQGQQVRIGWGNSHQPTERVLQRIKEWDDIDALPLPKEHQEYNFFSWKIRQSESDALGSDEIRIYHQGGETLLLNGIVGSFAGMEECWSQAVDNIDYPIHVIDQQGFNHTNPKYQELHAQQST